MLHRLWLLFAQICTVAVALLFVVSTLRPEWVRVPFFSGKTAPTAQPPALPAELRPQAQLQTPATPAAAVNSYADAVKRALPAVVSIQTRRVDRRASPYANDPLFDRLFGRKQERSQPLGEGSGVIVSGEGHVLTNFHVIEGANDIEIALVDGRSMKAKVIGADPESDLAVLQVAERNLPTMALGNSDALEVGDVVLAMGNPYGISNTVTMGIVSALARKRVSETNPFEDFIQTDAAINPGNSGGPLVNTRGELVGINTAIFTRTGSTAGIGFSIPSNLARSTMEQILTTGMVKRGYLGVSMGNLNPGVLQNLGLPNHIKGAFVAGVVDGEPAATAGMRAQDVITQINGQTVVDEFEAIAAIANSRPGAIVPVVVVRRDQLVTLNVTLGERPARIRR